MIDRRQIERYVATLYGQAKGREGVHAFVTALDPANPGREKRIATRDLQTVIGHAERHDRPGRGVYACVNMLRATEQKRSKEALGLLVAVHVDLDWKDIEATPEEALSAIEGLRIAPTMVVRSGGGAHLYWVLSDPLEATDANIDLIESLNERAADMLGAAASTRDVSRLLRIPGTHNSKRALPGEEGVAVVIDDDLSSGEPADADDLDEWLSEQGPVLRAKAPSGQAVAAPENPWLAVARQQGFKAPIDVEQRLAAMSFGAAGDASIHQTQLQVSASMIARGAPADEVRQILLDATRGAAGSAGAKWNWRREEANIAKIVAGAVAKFPPAAERPIPKVVSETTKPQETQGRESDSLKVANGGEVVPFRQPKSRAKAQDKPDVVALIAEGVIEEVRANGGDLLLTEGQLHVYEDGIWRSATVADEQWLKSRIQEGCQALGAKLQNGVLNGAWKRLNEHPDLLRRKVDWDAPTHIVCRNGALNLSTGAFEAAGPQLFMRRRIDVDYDAKACSPMFEGLMARMFSDKENIERASIVGLIQEAFGAALAVKTLSREERKALILEGPSRTGKTELARVMSGLVGGPIASPSVADISAKDFGLQSFVGATAWIRDDATNEGDRLDPQRFKTIVTGEAVDINRKNRDPIRISLAIPVLLTCNSLPRSRDASDAIYNRSHIVEMTNVVSEIEAHAYRRAMGCPAGSSLGTYIFEQEASGILNWALRGLMRLRDRGGYEPPVSVQAAIQRFRDENNPVHAWATAALERHPRGRIARNDLRCSFNGWQREEEGDEARAWGGRAFFPKLRAACPWGSDYQDHSGGRWITGLRMTKAGLTWWQVNKDAPLKNGATGSATSQEGVNRLQEEDGNDVPSGFETPKTVETGAGNAPRF